MRFFLVFLFLSISVVSAAEPSILANVIFLLDSIVRGGEGNIGDVRVEPTSNSICNGDFSLSLGNRYFIDENFELRLTKSYIRYATIEIFYRGSLVHTDTMYIGSFRKIFSVEDRNIIFASNLVSLSPTIANLNASLTYEQSFEPIDISAKTDCTTGNLTVKITRNNVPVRNARVSIANGEGNACGRKIDTKTSDANGNVVFGRQFNGNYYILASGSEISGKEKITIGPGGLSCDVKPTLTLSAYPSCADEEVAISTEVKSNNNTVANAKVEIYDQSCTVLNKSATTAKDGKVVVMGLVEGTYCVKVSKEGYTSVQTIVSQICPLPINLNTELVCMNEKPALIVTTTSKNNPANDVTVALTRKINDRCSGSNVIEITNEQGNVTFSDLSEGSYCITAARDGYITSESFVDVPASYIAQCKPPAEIKPEISTDILCPSRDLIINLKNAPADAKIVITPSFRSFFSLFSCLSTERIEESVSDQILISAQRLKENCKYIIDVISNSKNLASTTLQYAPSCQLPDLDVTVREDCSNNQLLVSAVDNAKVDVYDSKCESILARDHTDKDGIAKITLVNGDYCIKVSKEGYNPAQTDVNFFCEMPLLDVSATADCKDEKIVILSDVTSKGDPVDAAVIITKFENGVCTTTEATEFTKGKYCVIANKDRYTQGQVVVDVSEGLINQCKPPDIPQVPSDIILQIRGDCNNLVVAALASSDGNRINGVNIDVYERTCTNLTGVNAITDGRGIATISGLEGETYCIKGTKSGYKEGKTIVELSCPLPSLEINAQPNCKNNKIEMETTVTSNDKKIENTNIKISEFKDGRCNASAVSEFTKGKYCISATKVGYNPAETIVDVSDSLINQCKPPESKDLSLDTELVCDGNNVLLKAAVDSNNKKIEDVNVDLKANSCSSGTIKSEKTNNSGNVIFTVTPNTYCLVANKDGYKTVDKIIPLGLYNAIASQCKVVEPPQINVQTRGDCNSLVISTIDEKGKNLENADIEILDVNCDKSISKNITDKNGITTIANLDGESYCIKASKSGYETTQKNVNISCPVEELTIDASPFCERDKLSINVTSKGKKIKDAEIELFDKDCVKSKNKKVLTDNNGSATISDLEGGAYCIKAIKPRYKISEKTVNKSCTNTPINPPIVEIPSIIIETKTSCDNKELSVIAKRGGSNAALSDASIVLYDSACRNNVASAATNNEGIATFSGLENNNYCAKASKSGFNSAQKNIALNCGSVPGIKSDLILSSEILCPDQDLKISVNANGAAVSLRGDGACKAELLKNSQNNFVIFQSEQLTKGCNYKIRATHSDYNHAELELNYGSGTFACAKPSIKIEPSVTCPSELTVKVLVDDKPKQNADVKIMKKYTITEINPPSSILCHAKTDSAGQAKCTNLKQSEYTIEAEVALTSRTKYTATETARLTNCIKSEQNYANQPSETYDILANDSGNVGDQLAATAYRNGEPMSFANVSIISPKGEEQMLTADEHGAVVIPLEFIGDYKLSLIKEPGVVVKSKTVKAVLTLEDVNVKETKAGFSLSPLHVLFIPLFLIVALLIYGYYRNRKEGEFYRV